MDKLSLEHLSPYIPYGLNMYHKESAVKIQKMTHFDLSVDLLQHHNKWRTKPMLRPISDLIKLIEHDGRKFIPMHQLKNGGTDLNEFRFLEWKGYSAIDNEEHETCYDPETMSFNQFYRGDSRMCTKQYEKMQLLFKWHFDVFGLINKGLAIDINSVQPGKEGSNGKAS
ncbi:hypothetical protein [Sphingobacterium paramultivorum]|uniref:hypothetical protein n=1 Tax=Sphingobacterium paramultivorum TaxID=2886510 RepID=UPI00129C9450|nr:hypothetical protein [Sphingobacterium paramultivorum]